MMSPQADLTSRSLPMDSENMSYEVNALSDVIWRQQNRTQYFS